MSLPSSGKPAPASPGPASPSGAFPLLAATLAALLCLFVNRHTLGYGFVAYDDDQRMVFNAHLGGPSRDRLAWMFCTTGFNGYYMPLGWLSLSLLYGIAGLHPEPYHAALVGFHALNAVLLFVLIRRLLPAVVPGLAAKASPAWTDTCALLGALWWALNPLRVESTAWVSGLSYAQAIALAFAAVIVHLGPRRAPIREARPGALQPEPGRPRPGSAGLRSLRSAWLRPAAATALYAGSLLTYPIALGLAPVFILIDRFSGGEAPTGAAGVSDPPDADRRSRGPGRWLNVRTAGFVVAAGLVLAVTLQGPRKTAAHFHMNEAALPLPIRAARASYALSYYVMRPWVPVGLSLVYPATLARPGTPLGFGDHPFWKPVIVAGIGAALLIASLCLVSRPVRRTAGPFLLCHLLLLAPMLGLTENGDYFTNDRYVALACGAWAAGAALLLLRTRDRFRPAAAAACCIGLAGLACLSVRQAAVWRDTASLSAGIASRLADDGYPDFHYDHEAFALEMSGRYDEAAALVARQLAALPGDQALLELRRDIAACRLAYRRYCPYAELHVAMARDFLRAADWHEADEHLRLALVLSPGYAEAAYDRALVRLDLGEYRDALHDLLWAEARSPAPLSPAQRGAVLARIAGQAAAQRDPDLARAVLGTMAAR